MTEREKDILGLIAKQCPDYVIAKQLNITRGSVARSKKAAYKKLKRAKADVRFANELHLKLVTKKERCTRSKARVEVQLSKNCTVSPSIIGMRKNKKTGK